MYHFNTAQMAGALDGQGSLCDLLPPDRFVGCEVSSTTTLEILEFGVFQL